MQSQKEVLAALAKTVQEIDEVLAKSKWEPWMESDGAKDSMEKAEPSEAPAEAPQDKIEDKAEGMAAEADAERDQEAGQEGAPQQEGQGEGQGEEAELAGMIKGMESDHLMKMMEMIHDELQSRDSQEAPAQEQAPAPQEAPQAEAAEKSVKEEYAKMHKSMEAAIARINTLETKLAEATKPAPKVEKKPVVTRAAATSTVQVLEKSAPAPQKPSRLSKSETIDFLLNQVRQGNKLVDRDVIAEMNLAKDEDHLAYMQDSLIKRGINLPK